MRRQTRIIPQPRQGSSDRLTTPIPGPGLPGADGAAGPVHDDGGHRTNGECSRHMQRRKRAAALAPVIHSQGLVGPEAPRAVLEDFRGDRAQSAGLEHSVGLDSPGTVVEHPAQRLGSGHQRGRRRSIARAVAILAIEHGGLAGEMVTHAAVELVGRSYGRQRPAEQHSVGAIPTQW
jgi:hypothetical protein